MLHRRLHRRRLYCKGPARTLQVAWTERGSVGRFGARACERRRGSASNPNSEGNLTWIMVQGATAGPRKNDSARHSTLDAARRADGPEPAAVDEEAAARTNGGTCPRRWW